MSVCLEGTTERVRIPWTKFIPSGDGSGSTFFGCTCNNCIHSGMQSGGFNIRSSGNHVRIMAI